MPIEENASVILNVDHLEPDAGRGGAEMLLRRSVCGHGEEYRKSVLLAIII